VVDLRVAAYTDHDTAQEAWEAANKMVSDGVIEVRGLALVSRAADGTQLSSGGAARAGGVAAGGPSRGIPPAAITTHAVAA
jgi:hypothetical protein